MGHTTRQDKLSARTKQYKKWQFSVAHSDECTRSELDGTSRFCSSGVKCGRKTSLCLTRSFIYPVHWLKLSRGSTMETRGSYGITVAGSAQISRKAYASGRQAVELAESVQKPYQRILVKVTKSDVRKYGYLRRYTACVFICVDSLSELIGRVRPKAVSQTQPACNMQG